MRPGESIPSPLVIRSTGLEQSGSAFTWLGSALREREDNEDEFWEVDSPKELVDRCSTVSFRDIRTCWRLEIKGGRKLFFTEVVMAIIVQRQNI